MRATVLSSLASITLALISSNVSGASSSLPRFTEEREAAALHFVRKHCPELVPLLDELRKSSSPQYQVQVSEIFRVTEMLASIEDERRQQVELKIWKAENRALVLVARLATTRSEDRRALENSLQDAARELVELDVQVLELQANQLTKDLVQTREDLSRLKENPDKSARDRFDALLNMAKKQKKM